MQYPSQLSFPSGLTLATRSDLSGVNPCPRRVNWRPVLSCVLNPYRSKSPPFDLTTTCHRSVSFLHGRGLSDHEGLARRLALLYPMPISFRRLIRKSCTSPSWRRLASSSSIFDISSSRARAVSTSSTAPHLVQNLETEEFRNLAKKNYEVGPDYIYWWNPEERELPPGYQ